MGFVQQLAVITEQVLGLDFHISFTLMLKEHSLKKKKKNLIHVFFPRKSGVCQGVVILTLKRNYALCTGVLCRR